MRTTPVASFCAATLVALLPAFASADDHPNLGKNTLAGAWDVVVTLRAPAADCTTAPPIGVGLNPFPQLYAFHKGGTASEYGTRAPPSTRTSGHGVWSRTGGDDFAYRVMFYSFDANGLLSNKMDIRSTLTLAADGDTFEGVSRFAFSDLSGNVRNFCATLAGTRISL